jgi:nickel/cobalt exporter
MTWRIWRDAGKAQAMAAPQDHAHHHHDHDHHHHHDHDHDDHHHDHHDHAHDHDHGRHHHRHGAGASLAATVEENAFEHELLDIDPTVYADSHEREHALDIERRFAGREVTTGQIVLFGLTGGLIPCPASITVLLLCLQVGRIALGAALVLSFSIGLALTLVFVGVAAAVGVRHAVSRWPGFDALASRAPYLSSALVALVGLYTIWLGASALA